MKKVMEIEDAKVQKVGKMSLMIILPKAKCEKHNVKAGDILPRVDVYKEE